jgi:hypothetical protein
MISTEVWELDLYLLSCILDYNSCMALLAKFYSVPDMNVRVQFPVPPVCLFPSKLIYIKYYYVQGAGIA